MRLEAEVRVVKGPVDDDLAARRPERRVAVEAEVSRDRRLEARRSAGSGATPRWVVAWKIRQAKAVEDGRRR